MEINDFPPMLATERPIAFDLPGWIYEIKYDGWRMTAMFGDGKCRLRTPNGADCTRWFPEVATSLAALPGGPHIVDGEVAVFDDIGRSNFELLQARGRRRRWFEGADPAGYAVFDLLVLAGEDITAEPLRARKGRLTDLFAERPNSILQIGHFVIGSERLYTEAVLGLGLEGLVAKRLDSPYRPGVRSPDWVKIKRPGAVPAERFKHAKR